MSLRSDLGRGEETGAILVLWVVALTALLLFVALAVDLGNLGQTVRLSQNSVDSAALLGAQELGLGDAPATMVSDVETQFSQNYGGVSWDWTACTEVSGFTYSVDSSNPAQDCIGYGSTTTGSLVVDVVLPSNAPVGLTAFSNKVGGPSQVTVHTSAQASVQNPGGIAILPIGISSGAGGGGLTCIKGGNGNHSCPNNISPGDEGIVDSPRYRTFVGTANDGKGNNDTTKVDLAIGLDHSWLQYLSSFGNNYFCDSDGSGDAKANKCSPGSLDNVNSPLNYDSSSYIFPLSGNTASSVQDGLLDGFSSSSSSEPNANCTFSPRLEHPDGWAAQATCGSVAANSPASPTITLDGNTLNGRQISWYMLNSENGQTVPAQGATEFANAYPGVSTSAPGTDNVNSATWTASDNQTLSSDMSTQTQAASPQVWFSSSIAQSPRFAFVPVLSGCAGGGSSFCKITGFEAAYLDQILIQGSDVSVEAWIFSPKMIENGPAPPGPGSGGFSGGPFVVNLCHETGMSGVLSGNC